MAIHSFHPAPSVSRQLGEVGDLPLPWHHVLVVIVPQGQLLTGCGVLMVVEILKSLHWESFETLNPKDNDRLTNTYT